MKNTARTEGLIASIARSAVTTLVLIGSAASAALLLYLSYLFEAVAYTQVFGDLATQPLWPGGSITFAEGLAAGLNSAKVALVFVTAQLLARGRGWRTLFPRSIRFFLIGVSVVMTLLVVGGQTISPGAQDRLLAAQATIAEREQELIRQVSTGIDQRQDQLTSVFNNDLSTLTSAHFARITELQESLDAERQIGTGTSFYGPRYQDIERNIELERSDFAERSANLRTTHERALAELGTERQGRIAAMVVDAEAQRGAIDLASVFDADEAQNEYLLRFLEIARYIAPSDIDVEIVALTIFISVIISLSVELAPIVILAFIFDTLARRNASEDQDRTSIKTPEPANSDGEPHDAHGKTRSDLSDTPSGDKKRDWLRPTG